MNGIEQNEDSDGAFASRSRCCVCRLDSLGSNQNEE
jgi:hypothetical protein